MNFPGANTTHWHRDFPVHDWQLLTVITKDAPHLTLTLTFTLTFTLTLTLNLTLTLTLTRSSRRRLTTRRTQAG